MAPVPIRAGSRAGDSLPLPAGALLCPLQCGVFCVSSRCWWPVLSVPGVHAVLADRGWPCSLNQELPLGVHASHPKGCLSPGIAGMGLRATSEQPQAPDGECSDLGHCLSPCVLTREIHSKEQRTGVCQPFPRAVPAALHWEGNQVQKTLITATPQIIKSVKYLYCHQIFVFVLPPNRDGIIPHIKLKVMIFFKEIIKCLTLSAYSAD